MDFSNRQAKMIEILPSAHFLTINDLSKKLPLSQQISQYPHICKAFNYQQKHPQNISYLS